MSDRRRIGEIPGDKRRTVLAGERTALAWWRTGLAALAVAVGVGRIVPELQSTGATWPYEVLGVGFAIYGAGMFLRGTARGRMEAEALGVEDPVSDPAGYAFAAAGPVLAVAVALLIVLT